VPVPSTPVPLDWAAIAEAYVALRDDDVTPAHISPWLERWSDLEKDIVETYTLLKRAAYQHTDDAAAEQAYNAFVEGLSSTHKGLEQWLIDKLFAMADLEPSPAHAYLFQRWRATAALYRQTNAPLLREIEALSAAYRQIMWTISQRATQHAAEHPQDPHAWATMSRHLWRQRRAEVNDLFQTLLRLRRQLALNTGLPDYRAYRWQELHRRYTPVECQAFQTAIEREVVPLVARYQATRETHPQLPPLDPISLIETVARILSRVDPEMSALFRQLEATGHLDIGERPGRAPVNEEWFFPRRGLPFLMLDADLFTLLHEFGHGFHDYVSLQRQGLIWNMGGPDEFQECAAVTMTLLASPYLARERGGPFAPDEAARLHHDNLALCVTSMPEFALQDAFEHWVYGEAPQNVRPDDMDAKWTELTRRFLPGDDANARGEDGAGWQRDQWSLFRMPFYMISYPLAAVGALQLWRRALTDPIEAVAAYKEALAVGHTRPLPELFVIAGARLPFDTSTVADLMHFVAPQLLA
jgi:oligoendopeptidase F